MAMKDVPRPLSYEVADMKVLLESSGMSRTGIDKQVADLVAAAKAEARQGTAGESLEDVLRDARYVYLVGVPPGQREDASRALRDFLSRAQLVGYRTGWRDGQTAGPKPTTLEELLSDVESCPCGSTTPANCTVRCEKDDL